MGDEYMTGVSISEPKVSIFSLALFTDTGWYSVDWTMADEFLWGYQEGCEFITEKCNSD